ncbi:o-succinylbenzoate synthase [Psychromonas sp. psych-6C06]|uniref:o-succinylbenzoate synthase n=1 Tax=Psychromonas sp. psych-6C06 TaxID=2058089 RepID=UPI000C33ACAA|nr:o-succinylbenzoate synthase [Psychromonas sp. psych-6C06]PKF61500.1 o-succinylbenzoate synthase [Psychromonas sp. psych-6C06]
MPPSDYAAEITSATLFTYQLPFKTAMQFKAQRLLQRKGLILQLNDGQGRTYFTEIAPLPGFSTETLEQVTQDIIQQISTSLASLSDYKSPYPSVQFALSGLFNNPISINHQQSIEMDNIALLQGDTEQVLAQFEALHRPAVIKLKVARESITTDIANFQLLCQLSPDLKIRCDANQAWNKKQASDFFDAINTPQLDYIEEPTSNHAINIQLAEENKIFLGLDETLQAPDFYYEHHEAIRAFVIKPTIIGNRNKIDQLVSVAHQQGILLSISSSFESALGLQQLRKMANHYLAQPEYQGVQISLGIDTLKYFDSPLLYNAKNIERDCRALAILWTNQ